MTIMGTLTVVWVLLLLALYTFAVGAVTFMVGYTWAARKAYKLMSSEIGLFAGDKIQHVKNFMSDVLAGS